MRANVDFDGLDGVLARHGGEFDDDEVTVVADILLSEIRSAEAPTPRDMPVRSRAPTPVAGDEPPRRRGLPVGLILGGLALAAIALIAVVVVVALGIGGASVVSRSTPEPPAQPEVATEVAPEPAAPSEVEAAVPAEPAVAEAPGGDAPPPGSTPVRGGSPLDGDGSVFPVAFGQDGYQFTGLDATTASAFASGARDCRGRVVVTGHTDDRGADDVNELIGLARAESVRRWLVSQGIATSSVDLRSSGSSDPVASNDTEDGRSTNRRVTITCTE